MMTELATAGVGFAIVYTAGDCCIPYVCVGQLHKSIKARVRLLARNRCHFLKVVASESASLKSKRSFDSIFSQLFYYKRSLTAAEMLGRGRDQRREAGGPLGALVQGAAAGVGFASESIQHHREKKKARKQQEEQSTNNGHAASQDGRAGGEGLPEECDEAAWQLDEAQDDLAEANRTSMTNAQSSPSDPSAIADDFIRTHRSEDVPSPSGRLDLPVVITQRRPKARTRGFIQAYAPLLENVGIDQTEFLDFIDKLNKAVQPNPWLQAINLATLAAQNVPEPVSLAVSIATKMAADAASEIHSRTKTNAFLEKTNEEYFKPKGLIAVLMTWKPQDSSVVTTAGFDLNSTVTSPSTASKGTFAKFQSRLKPSSAATSFEFPEIAPLVFPALDELASAATESPGAEAKKKNAIKRSGSFLTDYLDRRAVAKWAGDNPESQMANMAPRPEFRSRYADPSHPASSGDLLAFVTGGKVSAGMARGQSQDAGSGRFGRGPVEGLRGWGGVHAFGSQGPYDERRSRADGTGPLLLVGGVKKLLQKVTYFPLSRILRRGFSLTVS